MAGTTTSASRRARLGARVRRVRVINGGAPGQAQGQHSPQVGGPRGRVCRRAHPRAVFSGRPVCWSGLERTDIGGVTSGPCLQRLRSPSDARERKARRAPELCPLGPSAGHVSRLRPWAGLQPGWLVHGRRTPRPQSSGLPRSRPKAPAHPRPLPLVPKAQSEAVDSLPRIGIIVDRRGVRPSEPAGWRNCGHADPGSRSAPGGIFGLAPSPPRNGVAGIAVFKPPPSPNVPTEAEPNPRRAGAFPLGAHSTLLRDAFLVGLLSLSLMLLGIARFRLSPGIGGYRAARVVVRHREEIASLGFGLLGCAAILFFL